MRGCFIFFYNVLLLLGDNLCFSLTKTCSGRVLVGLRGVAVCVEYF